MSLHKTRRVFFCRWCLREDLCTSSSTPKWCYKFQAHRAAYVLCLKCQLFSARNL